jgi:hypothetical protein
MHTTLNDVLRRGFANVDLEEELVRYFDDEREWTHTSTFDIKHFSRSRGLFVPVSREQMNEALKDPAVQAMMRIPSWLEWYRRQRKGAQADT